MVEEWEKYYKHNELKIIQHMELELLRVFIYICKKLELEWICYGGTLLGYEKYKGFIPWDDDIDVALPRSSYEKFCMEASAYMPEGYKLITPYNTKTCPYFYAKLIKEGTKCIEYRTRNCDIETGIYIDIYPIDKIPDNEQLRKRQFRNVRLFEGLYRLRQIPLYDRPVSGSIENLKRVIKFVAHFALRIIPQKVLAKRIDYYMTRYNRTNSERYAALNSPNYNNIYDELYPLKEVEFEKIKVFVPSEYRKHLLLRYGDYESELPQDKRIGHVPYIIELGDNLNEIDIE